jgi:hypothetical protein
MHAPFPFRLTYLALLLFLSFHLPGELTGKSVDEADTPSKLTEAEDMINLSVMDGQVATRTATLTMGEMINGKNTYSGIDNQGGTWLVIWQNNRWEIVVVNLLVFTSDYDNDLNPPNFSTDNWQSQINNVSLLSFDGSGTQAVELGFTLDVGPFTLDAGVQTGLGGGTPTGGIYSGPGVTDDGNGMTFSFDPMAAGVGTATISYGDGPDGANNVTQTIEVEEPGPQIRFELTNINQEVFSATLSQIDQVNGRNAYSGPSDTNNETVRVAWSGTRWEIFLGNGGNTLAFTSNYDVGPNPPDLATGNWNNLMPVILISFDRFDGSGTQAVELDFTLDAGPFTTDDAVQTGLGGGTPAGGIYSGPGVTDDGNGMTFSFDPMAAGAGMITVSYGDGPDGENNVTQTVEVFDLNVVCLLENFGGETVSTRNTLAGQNFTACSTGRVVSLDIDVISASGPITLAFNRGIDTEGPDYTQQIDSLGTGIVRITLDDPFIILEDSMYAFSLSGDLSIAGSNQNPFPGGNFFNENGQASSADIDFRLITEIDSTAVSTRPDLLNSVVNLSAFPNPAGGDFTVTYDLAETGHVTIVLYDQRGRVLRQLPQGRQGVGPQRVMVTNDHLPSGVLYYGLQTERGHSAVKSIIIR